MNKINDGGPAFPVPIAAHKVLGTVASDFKGMSLRDYFAVKAMQGIVSTTDSYTNDKIAIIYAEQSYRIADAMLAAREAGK